MKQLLLDIVNSIVDHQDKVKLEESTDEEGNINFLLTVDPEDMGKIIGKEGKVIKSIRNIIRIPAIKQNKKVNLELTEQERLVKEPDTTGGEEKVEETKEDKTTEDEKVEETVSESNEVNSESEEEKEDK